MLRTLTPGLVAVNFRGRTSVESVCPVFAQRFER